MIEATALLQKDVEDVISGYEQIIRGSASRTRQIIERRGLVDALSTLVENADLQRGFRTLRDSGRLDRTFEAVIVRHDKLFRDTVVKAAKWRLDNADNLK